MGKRQTPAQRLALVKALHDRRRERGECIYDRREFGEPPHAAPTRNKRRRDGGFDFCEACYQRKLAWTKAGRRRGRDGE